MSWLAEHAHAEERRTAGSDQTRERILVAAREVVARKGKSAATTREIAEVAGVNEATLFRHFGTKEKLLFELIQHCCPNLSVEASLGGLNGDIADDLAILGAFLMERLESVRDMLRWSLVEDDYEASIYGSATWRPQHAIRDALLSFMEARVQRGDLQGRAEDLAAIFGSMMFSHVIARQKYQGVEYYSDVNYALRTFIRIFLDGARSK